MRTRDEGRDAGPDAAQAEIEHVGDDQQRQEGRRARRSSVMRRRNARSPAPKKTPSSANSAPATGIIPTSHGHSTLAWSRTSASEVKSAGTIVRAGGEERADGDAEDEPGHEQAARQRRRGVDGARAEQAADQRLRGDRDRVEHERDEDPELEADLVRGDLGVAHARRDAAASRNAAVNASERRPRSRAARSCGSMRGQDGRERGRAAHEQHDEHGGRGDLRDDVRDRRALDAEPEAADQDERRARRSRDWRPRARRGRCACPGTRAASPAPRRSRA